MVKYKCNFCGKGGIPTKAGLKVHIQLSKAGCQEAMERQINWSLSPDEVIHIPQRQHTSPTPINKNRVSNDLGDVSYDDLPSFVPSPRHSEPPKLKTTGNKYQSEWARGDDVEDEEKYLRFAKEFPTPAEELGEAKTIFKKIILEEQKERNESPWTPFADKDKWELARWLAKNFNQKAMEEFLKLSGVSFIYFPIAAKKIIPI